MSDFLLAQIVRYGALFFGFILFLGALGLPVGASLLVIAAGAFVEQSILPWPLMIITGFIGAVLGDMLSYGIGRFAKERVGDRLKNSPAWKNAQDTFERHGAAAIYLTRFLITTLAIPTNLIAGSSDFGFWRFVAYDLPGELTWLILYGGLGYIFGSQWKWVSAFVTNFGWFLLGVVILIAGFVMAKRTSGRNVTR